MDIPERDLAQLVGAFRDAREAGDTERMTAVALRLPSGQRFGLHPGQIPALVHEAYSVATSPTDRSRLAAALARAWVYGGDIDRAPAFAAEAVDIAERLGDPEVLANALDATLVARWGPDDFDERRRLAARLVDTAAHLTDPELGLAAHLWRLTTAWECLDVVAVRRQLRALDVLAAETGDPRVAFFAAARRAMHALVIGDLDLSDRLTARAAVLGSQVGEPDLDAVVHSLVAGRARQRGDLVTLRDEAAAFEEHGSAEGVPSVSAEAAVLWLAAGEPDRALPLVHQLAGAGLEATPRDVDFLLTVTCLVEVASALRVDDVIAEGADLLESYSGRAVLNAGAVTFHGVVDDFLEQAHRALGDDATAWRHTATTSYRRIGATWWERRLGHAAVHAPPAPVVTLHLHQTTTGIWTVGRDGDTVALPDLKGLRYLRYLLQRPGLDIGASALAGAAEGHAVPEFGGDEIADAAALRAYRRRLRELDDELAEAESWADPARCERLRDERDALLDEVRSATGLGGRRRRTASTTERARVAVRKAIATSLDRIDHHDATVARLLRDTVHTGTACRYAPDPSRPVTWILDEPD